MLDDNYHITIDSIKGSVLYSDYKKYGYLPTIDRLLDWRNLLVEKREDDVKKEKCSPSDSCFIELFKMLSLLYCETP